MLRRGLVQLVAGRIPLLPKPGDEHLRQRDPLPSARAPRPAPGRTRARPRSSPCRAPGGRTRHRRAGGWTCESIRPGQHRLAAEIDALGGGAGHLQDVGVQSRRDDAPSRTAIAWTIRNCGSTVTILPLWKMWVGGGSRPQAAARTRARSTCTSRRFMATGVVVPERPGWLAAAVGTRVAHLVGPRLRCVAYMPAGGAETERLQELLRDSAGWTFGNRKVPMPCARSRESSCVRRAPPSSMNERSDTICPAAHQHKEDRPRFARRRRRRVLRCRPSLP